MHVAPLVRASGVLHRVASRLERRALPDDRLIWIFAAPRSGTTWTLRLLRSHPDVTGIDEPLLGAHLGVTAEAVAPGTEDEQLLLHRMADRPSYVFASRRRAEWLPPLRQLARQHLLARHADSLGDDGVVVVKEPHGSEACRLLHDLVPGSRCLFIVRDPRDVLDSVLDATTSDWLGNRSGRLEEAARRSLLESVGRRWKLAVHEMASLHAELGPDEALLVRYEDLLSDTETGLRRIVDWAGLAVEPGWIQSTVAEHAFESLPEDQRGAGHFHRAAAPGLWREHFSDGEAAWAARFFAEELERYGYRS